MSKKCYYLKRWRLHWSESYTLGCFRDGFDKIPYDNPKCSDDCPYFREIEEEADD